MNGLLLLQVQSQQPGGLSMLVPMAAIFVIFYFLLIRPQQKKQRETETMIKGIEKGDAVVTSGGIHGKVTGVSDDVLTVVTQSLDDDQAQDIRVIALAGKSQIADQMVIASGRSTRQLSAMADKLRK